MKTVSQRPTSCVSRYCAFGTIGLIFLLFANRPTVAQDNGGEATVSAAEPGTTPYTFAIPPEPLVDALDKFGLQTGIELLYSSHLTAGVKSPGVSGSMSADAALGCLLAGSNLAPVKSPTGVMTLVLNAQPITYGSNSPYLAPTLPLPTIQVQGPPLFNHRYYAMIVRYAIQGALRQNHDLGQAHYHIRMSVWVSSSGRIENFIFLGPTGDGEIDSSIATIMRHIAIAQPPPDDLPQPVHIQITAARAD